VDRESAVAKSGRPRARPTAILQREYFLRLPPSTITPAQDSWKSGGCEAHIGYRGLMSMALSTGYPLQDQRRPSRLSLRLNRGLAMTHIKGEAI
jgi:hypothetical protein